MFEELNVDFSQGEILKAISQLKPSRYGGPDHIINEFIIHGKHIFVPTMCNLFNKIYETGHFPDSWSEGYVIPLYKKGSINDVENYRGITLLSNVCKLFTRVLNNRLGELAETVQIFRVSVYDGSSFAAAQSALSGHAQKAILS